MLLGETLIRVGHRVRSRKVACLKFDDVKSWANKECVDLPVEMKAATNTLPQWSEPLLPGCDTMVIRATMFDKDQSPARLQKWLGLLKCPRRIRDRTQCPSYKHGVY